LETTIKSLPAAAFLLAKGHKLFRYELNSYGRVDFIFDDPHSNIIVTARDFFTGESLPARDYYRTLQDVRMGVNRTLNTKSGGAR
jgi:hypothetical protein